ncbi:hypothetical protein C8F04DRAFT_55106 [Mycena alexandri]|uniref:DUF1996 domain-containing protein n=1 Tax=Mycena alexandri TaxID=1745969 RepID=A0AAD6XAL3_9AGAR|nr:hypothetical protein C8F04DRAFT_55106 [Mycena alexandri]
MNVIPYFCPPRAQCVPQRHFNSASNGDYSTLRFMPFPGRLAGFLGRFVLPLFLLSPCGAYWLMASNNILTTQRLDPVVSPGSVSTHAHSVLGGSNFNFNTSTTALRNSSCTSIPIPEDKSNYWFPQLYFQCVKLERSIRFGFNHGC